MLSWQPSAISALISIIPAMRVDWLGTIVPSPKKQTKNVREKPNEKNDKYNMKLLYPTVFIPRFA